MAMNAISLLKQDHGNVDELFRRFEQAGEDAGAEVEKGRLRDKIVEQLSVHAAIEEQFLYPALRAKLGKEADSTVLEALEEHHLAKLSLSELEKLAPGAERFDAKMTVLIESVRHHVEEEERELFEKLREAFTNEELLELGDQMEAAKATAPTRPHPFAPDQPPLNLLIGLPVAVLDRAITTGKEVVGKLVASRNGR